MTGVSSPFVVKKSSWNYLYRADECLWAPVKPQLENISHLSLKTSYIWRCKASCQKAAVEFLAHDFSCCTSTPLQEHKYPDCLPVSCLSDLQEKVCRKPAALGKFCLAFAFFFFYSPPPLFLYIFVFCSNMVDLSGLQPSLWLSGLPQKHCSARHTALSKPGQFQLGSSSCLSMGPIHCWSSRRVLLFQMIPYPSQSHFTSSKANLRLTWG